MFMRLTTSIRLICALALIQSPQVSRANEDHEAAVQEAKRSVLFDKKNGLCTDKTGSKGEPLTTVIIARGDYVATLQLTASRTALIESGEDGRVKITKLSQKDFEKIIKAPTESTIIPCEEEKKNFGMGGPQPDKHNLEGVGACETCTSDDGKILLNKILPTAEEGRKLVCDAKKKEEVKAKSCWQSLVSSSSALSCLSNLLWGLVKASTDVASFLYHGVEFITTLPVKGFDKIAHTHFAAKIEKLMDAPEKFIKSWWRGTKEAEDRSSDSMAMVSALTPEQFKIVHKQLAQLEGANKSKDNESHNMWVKLADFIWREMTDNFGCQKWSGLPQAPGSTCVEPWTGGDCADCASKASIVCGGLGYMAGQIPSSMLLGFAVKYFTAGAIPIIRLSGKGIDGMQTLLSKASSMPAAQQGSKFTDMVADKLKSLSKLGNQVKEMPSKAIDTMISIGDNKIVRFASLGSISATAKGVRWYLRQIDLAFARGNGGTAKVLQVRQAHLEEGLEKQEAEIKALESKKQAFEDHEVAQPRLLRSMEEKINKLKAESEKLGSATRQARFNSSKYLFDGISKSYGYEYQAKNVIMSDDMIKLINHNPTWTNEQIKLEYASRVHQTWRDARRISSSQELEAAVNKEKANYQVEFEAHKINKKHLRLIVEYLDRELPRLQQDLKEGRVVYAPRMKPEKKSWANVAKAKDLVDIAAVPTQDLPPAWVLEQMAPAENMMRVLQYYRNSTGLIESPAQQIWMTTSYGDEAERLKAMANHLSKLPSSGIPDDPLYRAAAAELVGYTKRTSGGFSTYVSADAIAKSIDDYFRHSQVESGKNY